MSWIQLLHPLMPLTSCFLDSFLYHFPVAFQPCPLPHPRPPPSITSPDSPFNPPLFYPTASVMPSSSSLLALSIHALL